MEFDRSKVYTALNADELKIGSKVFVADNLATLKEYVDSERSMATIKHIANDSQEHRFIVQFDSDPNTCAWSFVYFISEPEEKNWIAYLRRRKGVKPYLTCCRSDCWEEVQKDFGAKTKLFEGIEEEANDWYEARKQFADVIAAWEDGKTIQYNSGHGWEDCCNNRPAWDVTSEYRIKPELLKWTDLKVGDIVHSINTGTDIPDIDIEAMVTAIDKDTATGFHVMIANDWTTDERLAKGWEKVE